MSWYFSLLTNDCVLWWVAINFFFSANSILTAEKRRLDGELRGLQQELDNLIAQMKNSEEKARKAMGDAGNK